MFTQRRFLLAVFSAIAVLGSASNSRATLTEVIATPFTGADTSVAILLNDEGGNIEVTLTVNEGLADLRGFFITIQDFSLLAGLSVTGDHVTGFEVEDDGVINLKHGVNLNGGGSPCPCDLGVALGTPGIGKDDIFTTTFVLDADADLVLDNFAGELIGIRVTSVGDGDANKDDWDSKGDYWDSDEDFRDKFSKFKKDCKDDHDGKDGNGGRNGSAKLSVQIPDPIVPVPEPSPALLVALGLGALACTSRFRSRR